MFAMRGRRALPVMLVGTAIAGTLAGGVATAVSSAGQQVHTCVAKKTGAVRVAAKCRRDERGLALGVVGPRGPAGPPGTAQALAWAYVGYDGSSVYGRGVVASHGGTGIYCVGLANAPSHDVGRYPVVTPIASDSGQTRLLAQLHVGGGAPACPVNQVEVDTFAYTTSTSPASFAPADEGFIVQLP